MSCVSATKKHNWDYWAPLPEFTRTEGKLHPFIYKRECQTLGCAAYELAEDLVPVGALKQLTVHYNSEGKLVDGGPK